MAFTHHRTDTQLTVRATSPGVEQSWSIPLPPTEPIRLWLDGELRQYDPEADIWDVVTVPPPEA